MIVVTSGESGRPRRVGLGSVPPSLLVLMGILSVQVGAGFAKKLFTAMPPTMVVFIRLATSAVVVGFMARKALRGLYRNHTRQDLLIAAGLGLALAGMNIAFYQSIKHIPLGVAVTIEFLGPLLVSVLSSRKAVDLLWAALAFLGVFLLAKGGADVNLVGIAWAALAGAGWAGYILATSAVGERIPGLTGLAFASIVGSAALVPLAGVAVAGQGGWSILTPQTLLVGVAVGLLSSVVPYSLEMEALRRIPKKVFGILMALEPAMAALVGVLLLGEVLSGLQWAAIIAVIVACIGSIRGAM